MQSKESVLTNTHIDTIIKRKYFTSSIFRIQFLMLSKDFSLVMSYTNIMPWKG